LDRYVLTVWAANAVLSTVGSGPRRTGPVVAPGSETIGDGGMLRVVGGSVGTGTVVAGGRVVGGGEAWVVGVVVGSVVGGCAGDTSTEAGLPTAGGTFGVGVGMGAGLGTGIGPSMVVVVPRGLVVVVSWGGSENGGRVVPHPAARLLVPSCMAGIRPVDSASSPRTTAAASTRGHLLPIAYS
jgi:hypothetical protein